MTKRLWPPTQDDVTTAARLVAVHWPEPVDEERITREWTSPRVDLEQDARIGDDVYVLVQDIDDGRAWIEVHGSDVSEALDWAESRASEMGARRLLAGAWSTDTPVLRELAARGFVLARQSRRMAIELDKPLGAPVWPEGISVRPMRLGEERSVYEVQQDAFRDTWEPLHESFEQWGHWLLQPRRFVPELWFLALDGTRICGIAICHPHPTVADLGWVCVLAVRREWRRRGIGRALLLHAFGAFKEQGLARAALGVDSDSPTGAHTLYEDAGMRTTQRFDIFEKAAA